MLVVKVHKIISLSFYEEKKVIFDKFRELEPINSSKVNYVFIEVKKLF